MIDIERMIEQQNWVELLDNFSKSTGVFIDIVNMEGERVIKNRECELSSFCKEVQRLDNGSCECRKSYKKACEECGKWGDIYYFRCHTGLVIWALPIKIEQRQVGAIICGQVLLWRPDNIFFKELKKFKPEIEQTENLKKTVYELKVISATTCKSLASLLHVFTNYLLNIYDKTISDEKKVLAWRQDILNQLKERKNQYKNCKFDNSVYIKREKRLLQYIRTGNRDKVIQLLPIIFTDIEVLGDYDYKMIKEYCVELMTSISRASIDGGTDADISLYILREFKKSIETYLTSEEMFSSLNDKIMELLDMIYIYGDKNQNNILMSVREYIEENYYKKITIDDIAEQVYVSKYYLCRLFKKNLNITINDYIVRIRIEKSIELMKKKELDINDIMQEVGFHSQSHFTKTFKKIIGITPGNYKKRFL